MKIRNGFVSNSSSSSFVLGKVYMTPEQIKDFHDYLSMLWKEDNGIETYIHENDYYFFGEISQHDSETRGFLNMIKVDKKYIGIMS